jgi:hypothetical protein
MRLGSIKTLGIALLLISLGLIGTFGEVSALIRVGGGVGFVEEGLAPLGRMVLEVIPLWFIALSLDVEYWFLPAEGQWLLPFVALSSPLIFHATVGAAPIVTISPQGVGLSDALALKGGIEVFIGPLGLFGEGLLFISSSEEISAGPFFAVGATLGF